MGVDGVLYCRCSIPSAPPTASTNYIFAISQLAQTTLRSEIGKIDLDRTFEERATINANVVREVDMASDPWGVKILRYEIRNINPPPDVIEAMEKQMRAEREKRAVILESEGVRDAQINRAEGDKQRVIKESRGHAAAARSTRPRARPRRSWRSPRRPQKGLRQVAIALDSPGGDAAMQLRDRRAVRRTVRPARQGRATPSSCPRTSPTCRR